MDRPLDKSWMSEDRRLPEYEEGVDQFLQFAKLNVEGRNVVRCPCIVCVNCMCLSLQEVKDHLFIHGIDQRYMTWFCHGEPLEKTQSRTSGNDFDYPPCQAYPIDDVPGMVEVVKASHEECTNDPNTLKKLPEDTEKPLYLGCYKYTKLSALAKLYRLKASNGFSDKSFSELLKLIADMLPDNNELPLTMYEAKKTLKALGLDYKKIHACPNDCILYHNDYAGVTECPRCHTSRWKKGTKVPQEGKNGVPAKVLWYFPPIPRFRRMF